MNKYEKFIIYKIYQNDDPSMLYIGSTTNLSRRKSQHKKNTYNKVSKKYHTPLYSYIRQFGWDKFTIEILEKFPCENKKQGLTREKELIEIHNAKLNVNKPIK